MKKLFLIVAWLLIPGITVYAETLTLSTYYPAPFGAYERLRLVPRVPLSDPCDIGTFYVQLPDILRYCVDDGTGSGTWGLTPGVWSQSGNYIFPTDTATNPNLNVGIGTTTPGAKLDVRGGNIFIGSADKTLDVAYTTGGSNYQATLGWEHLQLGNNSTNYIVAGNTATGGSLRFVVNNTANLSGIRAAGNHNGIEAMTILSNGNVGIGTAAPQQSLEIADKYLALSDGTEGGILFGGNTTNSPGGVGFAGLGGYWATDAQAGDMVMRVLNGGAIDFVTSPTDASSATTKMKITNSGRVGIGTADPQSELHVNGAVTFEPLLSPPLSPVRGTMYYDGNDDLFKYWNGTTWVKIIGEALGEQLLATVTKVGDKNVSGKGWNKIDGWNFNSTGTCILNPEGFVNNPEEFRIDTQCYPTGDLRIEWGIDDVAVDNIAVDADNINRTLKLQLQYQVSGSLSWNTLDRSDTYNDETPNSPLYDKNNWAPGQFSNYSTAPLLLTNLSARYDYVDFRVRVYLSTGWNNMKGKILDGFFIRITYVPLYGG